MNIIFFFFLRTYHTYWNNLPQLFNKKLREVEHTFEIKGSDGIACLWESTIKANRSSYPRFRPRYSLLILPYICICHGPLTQIIQSTTGYGPII